MSQGHAVLRVTRKIHLYIGVFTSPALLFFAMTGALQTFSLHETTQGSSYKPPAWIATLAQLHKKQTAVVPPRRVRPAQAESGPGEGSARERRGEAGSHEGGRKTGGSEDAEGNSAAAAPGQPPGAQPQMSGGSQPRPGEAGLSHQKSHLPMKIFFLLVALSLALSTLTGIYMAYKYSRNRWLLTGLLIAGAAAPLALLPF